MDFTLALTHFCEIHGPKSVLCTQVLPLECAICCEPRPRFQSNASTELYTTHVDAGAEHTSHDPPTGRFEQSPTDFHPTVNSNLSSRTNAAAENKTIEQHPLFRRSDVTTDSNRFPYGRASGETCASCTFTVPQAVAAQLPAGAPGSLPKEGGKPRHGAPVLRSREFVCLGKGRRRQTQDQTSSSQESPPSLAGSVDSVVSHTDCHDHTLTYLTSKSPDDPDSYAQLRASVIRALSCEVLPRGLSEGPFCFGDATTGYTIAYVFRLTDPKARGRRRAYAFVALAGKDAYRAFKACPMLWEAFATMCKTIEDAAQKSQDEDELRQQRSREDQLSSSNKSGYTEVTSFLTQRPRGLDGQPRRAGQTQPRSLAEIVGNENIFAILHQYFVAVLRCLGDKFGGLPVADHPPMVYQTTVDEEGLSDDKYPHRVNSDILASLQIDEDDEISTIKAT